MAKIRTVLCPVDLSPATPRQVALATELCLAFEARLILHHNQNDLPLGAGVGWMWAADHPRASAETIESRLQELLAEPSKHLATEAHITRGLALQSIVALGEAVNADLLVLSTHGATHEDHTSVTEQLLTRTNRAVLVLHEETVDRRTPSFVQTKGRAQIVLVPTDLTPESRTAVEMAIDLVRLLPLELHLLHLLHNKAARVVSDPAADHARERMRALVPEDLRERTVCHAARDDVVSGILQTATELQVAFIVMGEHTRRPVKRWFSRDTSRWVLHQAPCPVWYVPSRRAA